MEVSITVNGVTKRHDVEPRTLLVHHLGTEPPEDLNADSTYRSHLAKVLTKRALEAAAG